MIENKPQAVEVEEFLRESNAIEGVFDADSLQQATYAWNYLMNQKEMNIHVMCKVHKILMLHQPLQPDQRGYTRRVPVFIGGREALPWKIIPTRLATLSMNMWLHPKHWREHHIEYEKIHPFVDGNGRTGRMFMNWERLKVGEDLLIIHAGKEQTAYYDWFK